MPSAAAFEAQQHARSYSGRTSSTSSTTSSSNSSAFAAGAGAPGPVNKTLRLVMEQTPSSFTASPVSASSPRLFTSDSFQSQLQDSDFAPGTPLKVWGNVMFDESNTVDVASPPESPAAATEASSTGSLRHDSPPCKASMPPSQSFASDISPSSWALEVKTLLNSRQREQAIRLAAPSGNDLVRCYVQRVKGMLGASCSYQMFLEDGDVPLLISRRVSMSKSSAYLIAVSPEALKREPDCMSKLKSNFMGTEFLMSSGACASEELCIHFKANGLTGGPRSMSAVLPVPESEWEPSADGGLGAAMTQAKERSLPAHLEREMAIVCNKPPEFDDSRKCFTLLFKGRKVVTSKKNCQLVGWDHRTGRVGAECLLQFAKLKEDRYALDFAYPLNSLTAFAMALANMDEKLCHKI